MTDFKTIDNGCLIIFEGSDGVGKTTQLNLAAEKLQSDGWQVETLRNLGGSPMGEALRTIALSDVERLPETDLYISVAIQTELTAVIKAARQRGSIILLDRGPLSFYAYQVNGSGADPELGKHYADKAIADCQPELILLFQADISQALERAKLVSGKADYFESKPLEFFERVSQGLEETGDWYNARRINATASIDHVHAEVNSYIAKLLQKSAKH